jgi:hypothetical protein
MWAPRATNGRETESSKSQQPRKPALPKIGVIFLIESNIQGSLKAGRDVVPIKNRSGYVWRQASTRYR